MDGPWAKHRRRSLRCVRLCRGLGGIAIGDRCSYVPNQRLLGGVVRQAFPLLEQVPALVWRWSMKRLVLVCFLSFVCGCAEAVNADADEKTAVSPPPVAE